MAQEPVVLFRFFSGSFVKPSSSLELVILDFEFVLYPETAVV
jgi:hypothetical protein